MMQNEYKNYERKVVTMEMEKIFLERMQAEKQEKVNRYKILNQYVKKGQILFVGSSLMEQFPIYEFILDYNIKETIYNRGIGGYTTQEMKDELDTMIFDLEPSKIFINIGTNDLSLPDYTKEVLIDRYEEILDEIKERLPQTKLYILAYYPVNGDYDFGNEFAKQWLQVRTNKRINEANEALEQMAEKYQAKFININRNLLDENHNLKHEFSIEGVHMYANGYQAILEDLMSYVRE